MKLLLKVPIINDKIKATVREQVINAFGGNFAEVVIGGAGFNQEVEQFLRMIEFPYTVGYGMLSCTPPLRKELKKPGPTCSPNAYTKITRPKLSA